MHLQDDQTPIASSNMTDAIDQAIKKSVSLAQSLRTRTTDNLRTLKQGAAQLAAQADAEETHADAMHLLREFAERITTGVHALEELYARQLDVLRTFNIAVFGRTGVGKSSFIEALVHGDGLSVSDGRADYTTKVTGRTWRGCRVIDTPGINGWGRTAPREELEAQARSAVEVADVVLLCFDNSYQAAMEFEKAADWVRDYGKPCVALVNVKDRLWRFPPRAQSLESRRNIHQKVDDHVAYIRECLTSIRLSKVPIVAMSSLRALYARASEPYRGPAAEHRQTHLDQYGADTLEEWSNIAAFEALIVQALTLDASGLRLGMLYQQSSARITSLVDDLAEVGNHADRIRQPLEGTIQQLLKLFGLPQLRERKVKECARFYSQFQRLEELRGEFAAPIVGEYGRFLRQQLTANLHALHSQSVTRAESAILDAFDRRAKLSREQLRTAAFDEQKVKDTLTSIEAEARAFVSSRARLAFGGAALDLQWDLNLQTEADGNADGRARGAGYFMRGLGVGLSVLSSLAMTFSALNIWNPAGWIGVVASVVTTIASSLLSWLGAKSLKQAEVERLNARWSALHSVQTEIDAFYDRLIREVTQQLEQDGQRRLAQAATPLVMACGSLAALKRLTDAEGRRLKVELLDHPLTIDTQRLLHDAAAQAAEAKYSTGRAEQQLFLGESWLNTTEDTSAFAQRDSADYPRFSLSDFSSLNPASPNPRPGIVVPALAAGRNWLSRAQKEMAGEPLAKPALALLQSKWALDRPEAYFVGDYNAGKSSLIRRLLLAEGQPIPPHLRISARPATAQITGYDWRNLSLVDTPGFQSREQEHTARSLRSIPAAALVVHVFPPSLLTGDRTPLLRLLLGDRQRGLVGKAPNTLFIINRCDELGINPDFDPQGYVAICQRKRTELTDALTALGLQVLPEQILCVAGNPSAVLDDENSNTQAWDGIDALIRELDVREEELRGPGRERAILEAGIAWFSEITQKLGGQQSANEAKRLLLEQGLAIVTDALREAARLAEEQRATLRRVVEDHGRAALDAAWSARSEDELQKCVDLLADWWQSPGFQSTLRDFCAHSKRALDDWLAGWVGGLQRHISTSVFRAQFPELVFARLLPNTQEKLGPVAKKLRQVGSALKGATRDSVYQLGKALGFKFKPWGPTKLAAKLAKVGAVVGIVSTGAEFISLFRSVKKAKERERLRQQMAREVAEQVKKVTETLLDPKDGLGPAGFLVACGKELEQIRRALEAERQPLLDEAESLSRRQSVLHTFIDEAWSALGQSQTSAREDSNVKYMG